MAEDQSLHIPKDLLEDFKGGLSNDEITGNAETGSAVRSLEKSLDWIISALDSTAKEKGYPGIGKMNPGELAELSVIVIERNVSEDFMKRSPEMMFGAVLSGVVAQNVIHAKRKQSEEPEQTEKQPENNE